MRVGEFVANPQRELGHEEIASHRVSVFVALHNFRLLYHGANRPRSPGAEAVESGFLGRLRNGRPVA